MLVNTTTNGILTTNNDHPLLPVVDIGILHLGLLEEFDQTADHRTHIDLLVKDSLVDGDDHVTLLPAVKANDIISFRIGTIFTLRDARVLVMHR